MKPHRCPKLPWQHRRKILLAFRRRGEETQKRQCPPISHSARLTLSPQSRRRKRCAGASKCRRHCWQCWEGCSARRWLMTTCMRRERLQHSTMHRCPPPTMQSVNVTRGGTAEAGQLASDDHAALMEVQRPSSARIGRQQGLPQT